MPIALTGAADPDRPDDGGGDRSQALAPLTGQDAVATRDQARNARAALTRATTELARQQEQARAELDRRRSEMEAEFARRRSELEAMAAPLREQLAKLTEVLWAVDLYLGRDETLRLVHDGKPAPRETPITVRQRVLVMAEESLILMGRTATGMTSENVPEFIDWLLSDDANLNRVLPETKGVVVLIPTKVASRTGNAFEDAARNAQNERSYWLIRNGERLYLLTVDPELRIGKRLLPRRNEFTDVFDQRLFGFGRRDGEPVAPGSEEWLEMERIADVRRRHFMRVLLVLQGIIDRTPALHPLPEGGASFLRLSDQDDGRVVLLNDADDGYTLGTGGESFAAYQARLNRLLRPGMRIVGDFRARGFRDLEAEYTSGHPRLYPRRVRSAPESNVPHLIEGRRDGGLVIRYRRTDKVEKRNVPIPDRPGWVYPYGEVEATQRASCIVMPEDAWVLPFDLVRVAELEAFLASRDERAKSFLSMVPTIRAVIAAKRAEASEEAPFRDLIGRLLVADGAAADDIESLVDELVHWWKVANLWSRALNGDREHEGKAATAIVAEYRHRVEAARDDRTAEMVAIGRTVPGVVAVARDKRGTWRAYSASVDMPGSEAMEEQVLLDVTTLRPNGTLGKVERGVVLAQRSVSALTVAWQDERWATWHFGVQRRNYLDGSERARLVEELRSAATGLPVAIVERFDPKEPERGRRIAMYSWRDGDPDTAPLRSSRAPLDSVGDRWSARREPSPIAMVEHTVVSDSGGVRLGAAADWPANPREFTHYSARIGSGPGRWGDVPWWPKEATDYGDVRSRLVWLDEQTLDRVMLWKARSQELAASEEKARRAAQQEASRWGSRLHEMIRGRVEASARARFDEDFPDADDLWPAHLASLNLPDPISRGDLQVIVSRWLDAGRNPEGRTLGDLATFAAEHPDRGALRRFEVGEYADIVVPALEPGDDEA